MRRILYAPLVALYYLLAREASDRDVRRFHEPRLDVVLPPKADVQMIASALTREDFRSLFYYRLRQTGLAGKVAARVASWFYKGAPALFLPCPSIGPGLYISHGFATILLAGSVGDDCLLSQQVTVGYTDHGGPPTIGNRVRIGAGAQILGPIHVGDDAVIGAGAVVVTDVPAGAVMGGVPAKVLTTARDVYRRSE